MPAPVGYCALLPPSYDAQSAKKFPVIYFLHGLGGDHTFLVATGGWSLIEGLEERKRIGEIVVITPDADSTFYINAKNGSTRYEDFFIRDFVPRMEKHFRLLSTRSGRPLLESPWADMGPCALPSSIRKCSPLSAHRCRPCSSNYRMEQAMPDSQHFSGQRSGVRLTSLSGRRIRLLCLPARPACMD